MASRKLRAFRSRLLYRVLIIGGAVIRRLPLFVGQSLGRALGSLAWYVAIRDRRKALANLAVAFPEWDEARRRSTIRAMFRHFGMALFELAWLPNVDVATRNKLTSFENVEPMLQRMRDGRGVIIVTGHCGNWEWLAYSLGLFGFPMAVLQRERDDPEMNRYITDIRAGAGIRTIDRGSPAAGREMITAVRRAGMLGFLIDQNIRAESVKVPFFGRPALTPIGPAKLAVRAEATVVALFIERRPDGTHHARFSDPIECKRTDDPVALTALLTRAIEDQIRRAPEQWVWIHDRWRERPAWEVKD